MSYLERFNGPECRFSLLALEGKEQELERLLGSIRVGTRRIPTAFASYLNLAAAAKDLPLVAMPIERPARLSLEDIARQSGSLGIADLVQCEEAIRERNLVEVMRLGEVDLRDEDGLFMEMYAAGGGSYEAL